MLAIARRRQEKYRHSLGQLDEARAHAKRLSQHARSVEAEAARLVNEASAALAAGDQSLSSRLLQQAEAMRDKAVAAGREAEAAGMQVRMVERQHCAVASWLLVSSMLLPVKPRTCC